MSFIFKTAACFGLAFLLAHCGDSADSGQGDGWYPGVDAGAGGGKDSGKGGGKKDGATGGGGGDDDAGDNGGDDNGGDDNGGDDDDEGDNGGDDDDAGGNGGTDSGGGHDSGQSACANPGHENPGQYPQTDFNPQPAYIPNDTLVLTLDDGPDTTQTP